MTPRLNDGRVSDESWFEDDLPRTAGDVVLEWFGRDSLDLEVAHDTALQNYLEGPDAQILQRAKEFQQEQAVLAGGAKDLFARNAKLRQRADEISIHWRSNWAVEKDIQVYSLEEKYPGAAEDDPIVLRPTFSFDLQNRAAVDLHTQLERTLAFGGTVDIPGEHVVSFDVDASPEARLLLHEPTTTTRVSIRSIVTPLEPPLSARLSYVVESGEEAAGVDLYLTQRTGGAQGVTATGADPAGILSITITLPHLSKASVEPQSADELSITIETRDVQGRMLHEAAAVAELLAAATPGRHMRLEIGTDLVITGPPLTEAEYPSAERLANVIRALRRLQRHAGLRRLHFPNGMTEGQADMLLTAARLIEGEQIDISGEEWTARAVPDQVSIMLTQFTQEPFQLLFTRPEAVLVAGDLQIPYGPLTQWGPELRIANRAELERHDGRSPVTVRFATGDRPVCWLPYDTARALAEQSSSDDPVAATSPAEHPKATDPLLRP